MNEIDDSYDSDSEELDQNFFEELEAGKDRKTALTTYVGKLDSLRSTREKAYTTYLAKRKKEIWEKKKKKEGPEKFAHLEVKHFVFSFSRYERFKQFLDVSWFRFKRFVLITFWSFMPRFLIYRYYSFKKEVVDLWEIVGSFFGRLKRRLQRFFVRLGIWIWKLMKRYGLLVWKWIRWLVSKLLFWRKKSESGEGEEGETGKKTEGSEKKATGEEVENADGEAAKPKEEAAQSS